MCSRPFETRSLPSSLAATHRGFTFYVAFPKRSIRPRGLPIYVARVPAAPFSLLPLSLFLLWRFSQSLHSSFLIPTSLSRCDPFLLPYSLALLPPKLRSQWARSDS